MDLTNAIEIDSLTKMFGNFVAVNEVTMTVKRGEYMGLLGPNGSGKSTMLKVIAGMMAPTSGSVTVNGIDPKDHRKALETVGCVIEIPECYPEFTPTEMLNCVGRIRGMNNSDLNIRIREVLDEVRMTEWKDKKIGQFSKGMKQRIALATALIHDPDILILDEPTSGLDPRGTIEIREILMNLKRSGRSLLISTHMLNEVSEICDSVTVIRRGKMMVSGDVRKLLTESTGNAVMEITVRNEITKEFMDDLQSYEGISDAEKLNAYKVAVSLLNENDGDGVAELVRKHDLGLISMERKKSGLESLYMSFTEEDERDDIR